MHDFMYALSLGVNKLTNTLMRAALALGICFCVVMVIAAVGQVISRMTNWFEFIESEEIARFSMCWLAMLGSAVGLRQGRHLGVRLLVEKLPSGFYNRYFVPVIQLVMLSFFLMIVVEGIGFCERGAYQVSPAMDLPMFYVYLSIPIGGALMALNVVSDMLQDRFPTQEGSDANIAATVIENVKEIDAAKDAPVEIFDPLNNPKPDEETP